VFIPPSSSKIHGMLSLDLVFDFINFQKILLSSFIQGDINNMWQRFADDIKIIYEENIPESKSMSRKYDTPWINEESKIALVDDLVGYLPCILSLL
jgi:hypothetical protein